MNAGASLYIGGKAGSMKDGIILAAQLIDSGKAAGNTEPAHHCQQPPGGRNMTILDCLAAHAKERTEQKKDSCRRQKSGARHSHCPRTSSSSKTP